MKSTVGSRQLRVHSAQQFSLAVLTLIARSARANKFRRARCRRSAGPPKAPTRCRCSTSTPISSASGPSNGRCRRVRSVPLGRTPGRPSFTKVDGRFYEAVTEGEGPSGPFKVRELIAYHKENKVLARQVTDSRGFNYHAVWSGGRRSRRDLQHPLRQRTVHRQRQVGARAKRRCTCSRHSTIEWRAQSRSTAGRSRISERRGGERAP